MGADEAIRGWAALPLRELLSTAPREATVVAAGGFAAYLATNDASGEVVALVARNAVRLPLAVQVPLLPWLTPGMPASIGGGVVRADGQRWQPVRWWDPRPHVSPEQLLTSAPALTQLCADMSGTAYGVDVATATRAVQGLAYGDPAVAHLLLGQGPGFTPAGDDVVAGALAALALAGALDPVTRNDVLTCARDRTTTLSAALLRCAARGDVVPQVSALLTALGAGAPKPVVRNRAAALLAVGATSGAAMLLGLTTALATVAGADMELT